MKFVTKSIIFCSLVVLCWSTPSKTNDIESAEKKSLKWMPYKFDQSQNLNIMLKHHYRYSELCLPLSTKWVIAKISTRDKKKLTKWNNDIDESFKKFLDTNKKFWITDKKEEPIRMISVSQDRRRWVKKMLIPETKVSMPKFDIPNCHGNELQKEAKCVTEYTKKAVCYYAMKRENRKVVLGDFIEGKYKKDSAYRLVSSVGTFKDMWLYEENEYCNCQ